MHIWIGNSNSILEPPTHYLLLLVGGDKSPGPLKCFCIPSHQILAIGAPQKARNRDKA